MNVFELEGVISLNIDGFNRNLDVASSKFKSFSDSIKGISEKIDKAYSGIGNLLSPAVDGFKAVESVGGKAASTVTNGLKALAGAATVAAGGATMVGKSAFDAYANYEQLVGGVETLFKEHADSVMENARKAYKTAGLSANEYMDQVNSFAASLRQSLGEEYFWQIANYADMAVIDMSDNANKMGTNMERITDAYQGFAKQNYTMLDNLKLGYGGTKSEMERLLSDAEKLAGYSAGALNIENFADIVDAIHIIQEEMGITGTTALEASTTIQGSVASMKGAWENFMVGIADSNQNMGSLMDNLINSVVTAGNNVVPRIQEIINQALCVFPELVRGFSTILPEFARMGGEIVKTLVDGFSVHIPELLDFGSKAVGAIAEGIAANAGKVADGIIGFISGIATMIGNNSEKLVGAGYSIVNTILRAFNASGYQISKYIDDFIPLIAYAFIEKHEALFRVGMEILSGIGQGIVDSKTEISEVTAEAIASMVVALHENAPAIIEGGLALLEALVGAITENLPLIIETGAVIIGKLVEGIATASPGVQAIIATAVLPHILKIVETVGSIGGAVSSVASLASSAINTVIGIGGKLMSGIKVLFALITAHPVVAVVTAIIAAVTLLWTHCEGFRDGVKAILEAIGGFFKTAYEVITGAFADAVEFFSGVVDGIKGAFDGIGEFLGGLFKGAWEAVQGAWSTAIEFFTGIGDGIHSVFESVTGFLGETFSAAWDTVSGVWDAAVGFFSKIWDGISSAAKRSGEAVGKALKSAWDSIKKAWSGAISFFSGVASDIIGAFTGLPAKFLSIGSNIVQGIWNGVSGAWGSFMSWLEGKVGGIIDGVKSMLGIHSPSAVFAGIGENMALGLAAGWDDQYNSIKRQIENGMSFAPVSVGVTGNYSGPREGYGAERTGGQFGNGNFTVNIYNPEKRDAVTEAREWKKTAQRMAVAYG